jgi:hypothetical protein
MILFWGALMKTIKTLLVISTVLANVSMAYAQGSVAVISSSAGKVLVNKGKGFAPASGMLSLNVGDSVMVGKGSSAVISYNEGCSVNAAASSVLTVSETAPCAAGQAMLTADGVFVDAAADLDPTVAVPFLPLPLLLVGTVAVAAGASAVLGIGPFKKNNKAAPVSIPPA